MTEGLTSKQALEEAQGDDRIEDAEYTLLRMTEELHELDKRLSVMKSRVGLQVEIEYMQAKDANDKRKVAMLSTVEKRDQVTVERMEEDPECQKGLNEYADVLLGTKLLKIRIDYLKRSFDCQLEAYKYINMIRAKASVTIGEDGKITKTESADWHDQVIAGTIDDVEKQLVKELEKIRELKKDQAERAQVNSAADTQYT